MLQVIKCAVEAGLFVEHRSPPGSPKMSRLIPLSMLLARVPRDPQLFDSPPGERLVRLVSRPPESMDIEFDPMHPVAADCQSRLTVINRVNSACNISFTPDSPLELDFIEGRRLRPIHHARFTENWDSHGRLYTGPFGHQSLKKIERQTIKFDGEESIELDFSGMHTRLLYHRLETEYTGDPYALWGTDTTEPQRLLAKAMLNATINARTLQAAVSACNSKMQFRTEAGNWKRGKERERARELMAALQKTGLSFKAVQEVVMDAHQPIAQFFGCDMGMQLMRTDSAIALDVLSHFAEQGLPALGVHDSFIVAMAHAEELQWAMQTFYQRHTGQWPVIK